MSKLGAKGGRVACLLASGFEDSEFRVPCRRLRQAGYLVELVGERGAESLVGERGQETVTTDFGIHEVQVNDYDGLLIPGGRSHDTLRADQRFIDFTMDFDRTGRPLAAASRGPQFQGNWLTIPGPADLEAFSCQFIEALRSLEGRDRRLPGDALPPPCV